LCEGSKSLTGHSFPASSWSARKATTTSGHQAKLSTCLPNSLREVVGEAVEEGVEEEEAVEVAAVPMVEEEGEVAVEVLAAARAAKVRRPTVVLAVKAVGVEAEEDPKTEVVITQGPIHNPKAMEARLYQLLDPIFATRQVDVDRCVVMPCSLPSRCIIIFRVELRSVTP
jgi:hypothetical protein